MQHALWKTLVLAVVMATASLALPAFAADDAINDINALHKDAAA